MSDQGKTKEDYLAMVERELSRYEHPLFEWEAAPVDQGIQVIVRLKFAGIHDDPYRFLITPRELNAQGLPVGLSKAAIQLPSRLSG